MQLSQPDTNPMKVILSLKNQTHKTKAKTF